MVLPVLHSFPTRRSSDLQDRDLVERVPAALQVLDLLADGARLLFRIPRAGDGDLPARLVLGAHRLAEPARSEEHTSELQSRQYIICRLLLEKKKLSIM